MAQTAGLKPRSNLTIRSEDALIDHFLKSEDPLWEDIPLPSVATLLEHCRDARQFMDEFDLNDGFDNQAIMLMRVRGHMTRMIGYFQAMLSHSESNDRHGYLWSLTSMFRLICIMANEAELAPILSAACSLKHATDMKKAFSTQDEAFDKAKQMGLTPDQATRDVTPTPSGRFALYDARKGEIAKSDTWKPPDFRSLIQAAGTEAGKSEFSCVLDDTRTVVMARPMILSDETRPTDYTFANHVAAHVQTDQDLVDGSTPDELARTIQSHLWLANLEISSGIAPAMSTTSQMPRDPHPDGPTTMTWHQLEDAQKAIAQGHSDRNVSEMIKGVVANMHILSKFSREAGFLPYIGHAHYIYECYLKSQINSSRRPSGCDLSTVWSLQVDLDKDLPKACSLALKPSL